MKIGELSKKAGCQVVTIRFYEKEGLLNKVSRGSNNYRVYNNEDLERLSFIRHCRQHGMTLSEIRDILVFSDNPIVSCEWINKLIESHIKNVEKQILNLEHLKKHLETLLGKCNGEKGAKCGILESLKRHEECSYCENLKCHY